MGRCRCFFDSLKPSLPLGVFRFMVFPEIEEYQFWGPENSILVGACTCVYFSIPPWIVLLLGDDQLIVWFPGSKILCNRQPHSFGIAISAIFLFLSDKPKPPLYRCFDLMFTAVNQHLESHLYKYAIGWHCSYSYSPTTLNNSSWWFQASIDSLGLSNETAWVLRYQRLVSEIWQKKMLPNWIKYGTQN